MRWVEHAEASGNIHRTLTGSQTEPQCAEHAYSGLTTQVVMREKRAEGRLCMASLWEVSLLIQKSSGPHRSLAEG